MTKLMKTICAAAVVLAMPLVANSAMAAEAPHPTAQVKSLSGAVSAPTGILTKSNAAEEKIVVARRWRRRGGRRWVGPAIVGGLVAGALISGAARAHERDYYYRRRYGNRCERWLWKCDNGYGRACRKFYRYCD
ncbi:MAG: hypothetical protein K0U74_16325 [Alphaproteobacteria bacterium]|nr:hypothetical protein [Alphaproteobacteria bacterium]